MCFHAWRLKQSSHQDLASQFRIDPSGQRRGQVLVEFAIVAFVLYLLLAVTLDFGRALYSAQVLQQAADFAAREVAHTPLDPQLDFDQVFFDPALNSVIASDVYSEDYLVVLESQLLPRQSLLDFLAANAPPVNQLLGPLFIRDQIESQSNPGVVSSVAVFRYPGAIFTSSTAPSGYTVYIPLVVDRTGTGAETIDLVRVLEEIKSGDPANRSPFPITSPQRGLVSLRINYPYQAAAASAFRPNPAGPFEPTIGSPIPALDADVSVVDQDGFQPAGSPAQFGSGGPLRGNQPYGGTYGLGHHLALGQTLRPYRKVISAQAIYRREVFQ